MHRKRTEITKTLPNNITSLINGAKVFDSSCSTNAKVYFIDKDDGYFLKISNKNSLRREKEMTQIFNHLGLGAQVVSYISSDCDYLITTSVKGEDCTHISYLSNPKKLCDTLAEIANMLHRTKFDVMAIHNHTDEYISHTKDRYKKGFFDNDFAPIFKTSDDAMKFFEKNAHLLNAECLIHGDFCLPNIILSNDKFSGFIDVDHAGFGNRHIDLFWCIWSLSYNLKTDKYTERFLDAYGRDNVDIDAIKTVLVAEAFN